MPPDLSRIGPTPLYRQIEDWLRRQIESGVWPPGYKLEAEVELAQALGVNRGTLRKALAALTEAGLLVRTHGRGTFVAAPVIDQNLAERMVTFSEDLLSKGITFATKVLQQAVIQAHGPIETMLALPVGAPVFFVRRLRFVDGEPVAVMNNYLVYERCRGIETADLNTTQLFVALGRHLDRPLSHARRTFQARRATRVVAAALRIPPREAVMYGEELTFLDDGTPVHFAEFWLRGDRFRLTATVRRGRREVAEAPLSILEDTVPACKPA